MGFALNKFVDYFNGVFWPKKTGWVRAFREKPIFVLIFDELTFEKFQSIFINWMSVLIVGI